jgi:hypothetical protein
MSRLPFNNELIRLGVDAIVRLPEKAGIRRRDLHLATTMAVSEVSPDGGVYTNSLVGSSSPALIIIGKKDHPLSEQVDPLLLKIFHPKDSSFALSDQYIDSNSTAEALVLVDNVFWSLPADKFLQARARVRSHANFAALARSINLRCRHRLINAFRDAIVEDRIQCERCCNAIRCSGNTVDASGRGEVDKESRYMSKMMQQEPLRKFC